MMRASSIARDPFSLFRRIAVVFFGLLGIAASIVVFVVGVAVTVDLRPFVERYVTSKLDRRLTLGSFHIGWGSPLSVEVNGLRLANVPGGSAPEMVRIERLSAEIELLSLFTGVLRFKKFDVVKPEIVLERDARGIGNWRFGEDALSAPIDVAAVPRAPSRSPRFPTLNDFQLHGGSVTFRTYSGVILNIDLQDLAIRSAGEDAPVSLVLDGAYNATPVRVFAEMQSFSVLRNVSVPFGVGFSVSTPSVKIGFEGTMIAPLDFDGIRGAMQIDAKLLGDLLKTFGVGARAEYPLSLAGTFTRTGDYWQLSDAAGTLANSPVKGALTLVEGHLGTPNDIGIAANFVRLDLNPILAGSGEDKTGKGRAALSNDYRALPLRVDEKRGANLATRIKAKELVFRAMRIADFGVQGNLTSGEVNIGQLTFAFAGGTVEASGSAHSAGLGSRVTANVAILGADASQMAAMFGAEAGQIAGKIYGRFALEMSGETVNDALKVSRGQAVLAMAKGRIARAVLEKVSTDLRSLFRKDATSAQISCLLGVMNLQDGQGTISPFTLQTPGATVIGGGEVDFARERLDLTIKSKSASTGIFALDIPLHVGGSFAHLNVSSAIGSSAGWLDAPARNEPAHKLQPGLQQLADNNSCPS